MIASTINSNKENLQPMAVLVLWMGMGFSIALFSLEGWVHGF